MNQTDKNYEELAIEWQYQMILIIKQHLRKAGIPDEKAKDIVGDIIFDFGMLHQGELKCEGREFRPKIAFDDLSGNLVVSGDESNLHEYAFGSTDQAYEE